MFVQARLTKPPVEAFDQCVIRRRGMAREVEFDAVFIGPSIHNFARNSSTMHSNTGLEQHRIELLPIHGERLSFLVTDAEHASLSDMRISAGAAE